MDPTQLVVGGVALMPLIFGLVEFAKKLGLSGKNLTILSMLIGVFFGALYQAVQMFPVIAPYVVLALVSLSAGLATSGVYDFISRRTSVKG